MTMPSTKLLLLLTSIFLLGACGKTTDNQLVTPTPTANNLQSTRQIAFIKKAYQKDNTAFLDIDYVEWLTGEEGNKAAREDRMECPLDVSDCLPNGYYIRNSDPKIQTLPLSTDAGLFIIDWNQQNLHLRPITITDLINQIPDNPFWVETLNNQIIKISEQYRP